VAGNGRAPDPSELVYVPDASWTPVLVAWGVAGVLVGIFAGWVWAVAGGALALLALIVWIRNISDDLKRLPRRQRVTTASLPATPMRRATRS
jgi:hypothetical protein